MKTMKNALLVDDEPEICLLLSIVLSRAGVDCTMAHSVLDGRKALMTRPYDAVFVDVHLPDGLGYDLFPDVRAASPLAGLVAISAIHTEGERAKEAGADVFVPKPFDRANIMSALEQLGLRPGTKQITT